MEQKKLTIEESLEKLLALDNKIAIRALTGVMLVKVEEIVLFEYLSERSCWQMLLTDRKTYLLRLNTNSNILLEIHPTFVQINQYCIVNLNYLLFVESMTLRCDFHPPFSDITQNVSRHFYKQLKGRLIFI